MRRVPPFAVLLLVLSVFSLPTFLTGISSAVNPLTTSFPPATSITSVSWNPHVSCTPVITTVNSVIGNHFDRTTGGALESGGPYGVLATPADQVGSSTDLQESLSPPCTYPNVNGTVAGTFVEIHGVSLKYSGASFEDNLSGGKCSTHWSGADGGATYAGGATYCNTYGILADPAVYTGNCESLDTTSPKICIRVEIARDWKAAGYCGAGTVCDNATLDALNANRSQKVDIQGFVAWHPPSSAGHGYSSWELHPLTGVRLATTGPVVTVYKISPNPASTGQIVTVNFSATEPGGTIASISVNWGDSTTPDALSGTATSDTHSYFSTGNSRSKAFAVTITATDNGGSAGSATASETVNDRPPAITVGGVSQNPV